MNIELEAKVKRYEQEIKDYEGTTQELMQEVLYKNKINKSLNKVNEHISFKHDLIESKYNRTLEEIKVERQKK